ncbi:MAG: penicillin-binding protein, partial [Actinomycetota bacterium]|nr:penicillin-binding protein [Actinomycetota bacterium]
MDSRTDRLRTLRTLVLTIVLAGALLAGLLFPWVGGPALAAQRSTGLLGDPPIELTDAPPPGNTVMLAANGEVITSFYAENRDPVEPDQIA